MAGATIQAVLAASVRSTAPIVYYKTLSGGMLQTSGGSAASANNDPVGYWPDQIGTRHLGQSTSGKRPLLSTSAPSVVFDGTDDYMTNATPLTDVVGSVAIAFTTGSTPFAARGAQALVSAADEGAANKWFEIGISSNGRIYVEYNNAGTKQTVEAVTTLATQTSYAVLVTNDGTDWYVAIGAYGEQVLVITNVGGGYEWFGDVGGADNLVLGGTVTSAGLVRPFAGRILECAIYSRDITQ